MNPSDDTLKIALAFVEQPEESNRVQAAFANIGRAPLSKSIDEMLLQTPAITIGPALNSIAHLNQGRIVDLDAPDFRSYIIRKTGMSEQQLNDCVSALVTYERLTAAAMSSEGLLLIAARTEDASAQTGTTRTHLLRELKRRV